MQTTQDGDGVDFTSVPFRHVFVWQRNWDVLPNPLMRTEMIEIRDIRLEDAGEMPFSQDEKMVEAFPPHTPQKSLAKGISFWSAIRRF